MTLALDTSILIDLQNRVSSTLEKLGTLAKEHPAPARITFMNYVEFLYGLENKNVKNKQAALELLNNFMIVHTSTNAARVMVKLKHKYDQKGLQIALADLLIASIVIEQNLTLITKDTDFARIEELQKIII